MARPISRVMRLLPVAALAVAVLLTPGPAQAATRSYAASSEVFANPGRGFFTYSETHLGAAFEPLVAADLTQARLTESRSLVYRHYYLSRDAALPAADLARIAADFTAVRMAGVKIVLRFSYSDTSSADAPLARVLEHISQVAPTLKTNADVIAALQAGFIGQWGEWYYSDNFSSSPGVLTAQNWADRKAVLAALLAATDPSTQIQVRTPEYKRRLFPTVTRLGLHNDCFLAGTDDYGTFTAPDDPQWLAATTTTLVGGETCDVSSRSTWPTARAEMARYHWTYLNPSFNADVLASWGAAGRTETARRLGYRLHLTRATLPSTARPGTKATAQLTLTNDGYAAPITNRPVNLLLTTATGRTTTVRVPADLRTLLPGKTVTLRATFTAPARGTYSLALSLPDPSPRLATTPAYAIHLANPGVWDAKTGRNNLGATLTVG
ncbi:DUF4832 domain-containing protein [Paractinoplanes lichenicola]|uniref:DUF4832 domain-containing protein n=1 Tax=Paractinoplanes lichenicola TaxID=2802976 RepID=A0ABS1W189_9ACTN|nr:DUF4832 domain-containing protein [Actinoplanes lichenicola]MBL7260498.1 DUF4832 domain-containing protein [Actinoplanes lichenicola]